MYHRTSFKLAWGLLTVMTSDEREMGGGGGGGGGGGFEEEGGQHVRIVNKPAALLHGKFDDVSGPHQQLTSAMNKLCKAEPLI